MELSKKKEIILYIILSIFFAITIQQFPLFKGNSLHLLHAIKDFEFNKLQNDWIANQTNHLPFFTMFNHFLIKFFSLKILYFVHFILLSLCSFFLFLICKTQFKKLANVYLSIIWFALFLIIYHENSLFGGVAGQDIINEGYQPASFGVLFFIGIYFFLKKKNLFAVFFICLAATFHPTYTLHSGFLISGILIYLIFRKEFKEFFKVLIFYIILILPITIYVIYNFLLIESDILLEGQKILLNRIPHHANINHWFSNKDLLSVITYSISLLIVYKNKRIFLPLFIFGFVAIFLSVVDYFISNNTLSLAFPWRSSVILIPLSTTIILSFLLSKISLENKTLKLVSIVFFVLSCFFFFIKNHYIKNSNKDFNKNLELVKKINKNYDSIERILIPDNLTYIRMNTGLPIFIDWKHHAFKYDEIIHWKERLDLTRSFYNSKDFDDKKLILENINKIEKVTHILFYKKNFPLNCENLIDDKNFIFVEKNSCFGIN